MKKGESRMNLKQFFDDFSKKGNLSNAKTVTKLDQAVASMIEAIVSDKCDELGDKWPAFEAMLKRVAKSGETPNERVLSAFALIGFYHVFIRMWEDVEDES
jgi:hypothetical protein